jgi:putative transposase
MDDSSRLITCYGVFDYPATEHTLAILRQGFSGYGIPRDIVMDQGTRFVATRDRDFCPSHVREFLDHHGVNPVVDTVKYPQTNGNIERFFGEVERELKRLDLPIPLVTGTM